jgi:hypothetical protein
MNTIANVRIHGETHKQPVELFALEKQQLKPLPPIPADIGITETVRANNRFRVSLIPIVIRCQAFMLHSGWYFKPSPIGSAFIMTRS